MELQLNGLVVKPDEVLVVALPDTATQMEADEVSKALRDVGLEGRTLVVVGAAQLAAVKRA
jgi:hypothetical protein